MSYRVCALFLSSLVVVIGASYFVNAYYQLIVSLALIWAILAVAWNLFCGYTGLVSFGHAMYWGIGAYCVGIGMTEFGLSPLLSIPVGVMLAMIAAVIIGIPTLRLSGAYFGLAMLAYPLTMMSFFTWSGYREVFLPPPSSHWYDLQFRNPFFFILLAAVALSAAFVIHVRIHYSRLGACLRAIRQSESAAEASGINTWACKLRASIISAGVAAVAGGLYALALGVITTDSAFGFMVSAQAVVLPLFGGAGSPWGPVIGAGILVPSAEFLHATLGDRLPGISGLVYGIALIGIVLTAPEGLYWTFKDFVARWKARTQPLAPRLAGIESPPMQVSDLPRSSDELVARRTPPKPGERVLHVSGLHHSFGGVHALGGIELTVLAGAIHCVIGPNGAGKTTLFNVLNGFLKPTSGTVTHHGVSILGNRPHTICKMGIARTFQVPRVFSRMTVLENVLIGAYVVERDDDNATRLAQSALRQVRLDYRAHDTVANLTTYEVRLLELARALASQPEVILIDEVFAGIGKAEALEIESLLLTLRKNGLVIVIIEHTMESMLRIADEFTVIDHGKTLVSGKPLEVVKQRDVIKAYLGERWAAKALN
jgi:branched-chain amino acid transport system permease protein